MISKNAFWHRNRNGLVAVDAAAADILLPYFLARGKGYVAVEGGPESLGFTANRNMMDLKCFLEKVGRLVHGRPPSPVIMMRDLNAKQWQWGSLITNSRGGSG